MEDTKENEYGINMDNSICIGATAKVYKESRSIFYGERVDNGN